MFSQMAVKSFSTFQYDLQSGVFVTAACVLIVFSIGTAWLLLSAFCNRPARAKKDQTFLEFKTDLWTYALWQLQIVIACGIIVLFNLEPFAFSSAWDGSTRRLFMRVACITLATESTVRTLHKNAKENSTAERMGMKKAFDVLLVVALLILIIFLVAQGAVFPFLSSRSLADNRDIGMVVSSITGSILVATSLATTITFFLATAKAPPANADEVNYGPKPNQPTQIATFSDTMRGLTATSFSIAAVTLGSGLCLDAWLDPGARSTVYIESPTSSPTELYWLVFNVAFVLYVAAYFYLLFISRVVDGAMQIIRRFGAFGCCSPSKSKAYEPVDLSQYQDTSVSERQSLEIDSSSSFNGSRRAKLAWWF